MMLVPWKDVGIIGARLVSLRIHSAVGFPSPLSNDAGRACISSIAALDTSSANLIGFVLDSIVHLRESVRWTVASAVGRADLEVVLHRLPD